MKIEDSFQSKIQKLHPWFPLLVEDVKKDVKSDLLRQYPKIYQRHFSRMHFAKASVKELAPPLFQEISEGNEEFGEWVASCWMAKNSGIYEFFAHRLIQINPDFEKIEVLEGPKGETL